MSSLVTLIAVVVLAGVGCAADKTAPGATSPASEAYGRDGTAAGGEEPGATSEIVELRLDQPRTVAGGDLVVTWETCEDSRCPQGVQCVWAGEVTVGLAVKPAGAEAVEVRLTLGPPGDERSAIEVAGWKLRLVAVEPYPREGAVVERSDRIARIEILSD